MKKLSRLLTMLMLALALAGLVPRAAMAEQTIRIDTRVDMTEARSMLAMINAWRTSGSCWAWNESNTTKVTYPSLGAMQYDYALEISATFRAAETALQYSHTRPSGESCFTAFSVTGGYSWLGENIAAGPTTARAAFEAWKEENDSYSGQGHRRNMIEATRVGIGHVIYGGEHFWTMALANGSASVAATQALDNPSVFTIRVRDGLISNLSLRTSSGQSSATLGSGSSLTLGDDICLRFGYTPLLSPDIEWAVSGSCVKVEGDQLKAVSPGSATLTATVLGRSATMQVKVAKVKMSECDITCESYAHYTGSATKPAVTVSYGGKTLKEGTDYTLSYANNTRPGTGKVTVKGKGNYTGSAVKTFTVLRSGSSAPRGTVLKSDDGSADFRVTKTGKSGAAEVSYAVCRDTATKKVIIPDTLKKQGFVYRVTSVTGHPFKDCTNLRRVVLGKYVNYIGTAAFRGCTTLETVGMVHAVTKIGPKAFMDCTSLKEFAVTSQVKSIGSRAFRGCTSLKKLEIRTTLLTSKTVGSYAFKNVPRDAEITVPAKVAAKYKEILTSRGISSAATIREV